MKNYLNSSLKLLGVIFITHHTAVAVPIKGTVVAEAPQNYKLIALNKDGSSSVTSVKSNGKFTVNAKKNATLHLINSSGKYAGPVGAAKGTKFYQILTGTKGNIGKVTVASGYASAKYNGKTNKLFSKKKVSFDLDSGPLGAGNFGLVLNPVSQNSLAGSNIVVRAEDDELGEDIDKDGVPDILDIDDDGDLALDIVDPVQHANSEFNAEIASTLRLELQNSLNFNVGSATDEQVDALIQDNLFLLLLLQQDTNGSTVTSINVDCGTLSYCSNPGTATIQMDNPPITNGLLWSQYDPDGDGLPNLLISSGRLPEINIKPRAMRAQIGTGDTIFFNVTNADGTVVLPAVLPFVFATAPAIKDYTSNGATTTISYPVSASGSGTSGNPIALASQQVGLTFWKPQRSAIEGAESPGYIDMGGLRYGVYVSPQGTTAAPITCAASDYSGLSTTLQPLASVNGAQAVVDTAADAAANNTNTLSFILDIGACLTRAGVTASGTTVMIDLVATSEAQDQTSQSINFILP